MRQRYLKHERTNVNAFNVAIITYKNLSYFTYFYSDKKGHYTTKYLKSKKNKNTLDN